jgi:hypothetical protein
VDWAVVLMLVLGTVCLVHGYRVRAGKSRRFYALYTTKALYGTGALILLPSAVWLLGGAAALLLSNADVQPAGAVLALITFAAMIMSVVWTFKPAGFLKPRWLREVESGRAPEPEPAFPYGAPSATGGRRIYLPPIVYWGLWAATAVIFALYLVLDWSPSVLVGLGGAISLLAAHTPKKAR